MCGSTFSEKKVITLLVKCYNRNEIFLNVWFRKYFENVDSTISRINTTRKIISLNWRQFDDIITETRGAVAFLVERSKDAGQWVSI